MEYEFLIGDETGTRAFCFAAEEGIEWSTERKGSPGKLTFKVLADEAHAFSEGCAVRLTVAGDNVFFGYVFSQSRDKDGLITVTAYDQIRYMKNKDTVVYENKTAAQLLQMLAEDFYLRTGTVEDTGYVIPSRVEDNTSLLEMMESALDLTLMNTGRMFVLYDDFGKLTLKALSSMYVADQGLYLMVDGETAENFQYASSIDDNTYNRIKLVYDNESTGAREVYMVQNGADLNRWGLLQYYDTLSEGENGQAKAEALLKLYGKKTRTLKISGAIGDNRVRAGSVLIVRLGLGDMELNHFMLVETCRHIYKQGEHWMDLTLRGGEIVG